MCARPCTACHEYHLYTCSSSKLAIHRQYCTACIVSIITKLTRTVNKVIKIVWHTFSSYIPVVVGSNNCPPINYIIHACE